LSDDEVRQVWAEARLKGPNDAVKALLWVKGGWKSWSPSTRRMGHCGCPKRKRRLPAMHRPRPIRIRWSAQILHLGLQLPEDEVKQAWAEARRKNEIL